MSHAPKIGTEHRSVESVAITALVFKNIKLGQVALAHFVDAAERPAGAVSLHQFAISNRK